MSAPGRPLTVGGASRDAQLRAAALVALGWAALTPAELARHLGIAPGHAGRMLEQLERMGLVREHRVTTWDGHRRTYWLATGLRAAWRVGGRGEGQGRAGEALGGREQ